MRLETVLFDEVDAVSADNPSFGSAINEVDREATQAGLCGLGLHVEPVWRIVSITRAKGTQ